MAKKRVLERYEAWLARNKSWRGVSVTRKLLRADEIFEACLRAMNYHALAVLAGRYGNGTESEYAHVAHDLRVMLEEIGDRREGEGVVSRRRIGRGGSG